MMGKISVCIATYNGAKYIKEQLESILCQLSEDDEVIVSDDSSTDETLQRIAELDDSRIQIYIFDRFTKLSPKMKTRAKQVQIKPLIYS